MYFVTNINLYQSLFTFFLGLMEFELTLKTFHCTVIPYLVEFILTNVNILLLKSKFVCLWSFCLPGIMYIL